MVQLGMNCEHLWGSFVEWREMDLSNCKGEYGPIDALALPHVVNPDVERAICIRCGVDSYTLQTDPDFAKLLHILGSYE